MVPLVIFVPAIVVLFTTALAASPRRFQVVGLVLAGYMFWTLTEYWMHRLVFHFEPEEGIGARVHWIIHGVHHDHPNDPLRLVMPPSVSVPLALAFYGLFVLVLGTPWANVFASGFLAGYLIYDMTHYHVHHHRPRTRLGKLMRELHMRHHFQDDTRGFGVSAPVLGLRVRHAAEAPRARHRLAAVPFHVRLVQPLPAVTRPVLPVVDRAARERVLEEVDVHVQPPPPQSRSHRAAPRRR